MVPCPVFPPPNRMGGQVAPPSLLFASYWQHFWGPASYLLGLCSFSDYQPHIHTYLPTYIPTYLHTYLPTYLHAYMPTCLHAYIHTYLHTYIPTYLHTYIPTYLHSYIHHIHTANHKNQDWPPITNIPNTQHHHRPQGEGGTMRSKAGHPSPLEGETGAGRHWTIFIQIYMILYMYNHTHTHIYIYYIYTIVLYNYIYI